MIYYLFSTLHSWSSVSTPWDSSGPGFNFSLARSFSLELYPKYLLICNLCYFLPGCKSSVFFTCVFYNLFTPTEFCNKYALIFRLLKIPKNKFAFLITGLIDSLTCSCNKLLLSWQTNRKLYFAGLFKIEMGSVVIEIVIINLDDSHVRQKINSEFFTFPQIWKT